MSRNWKKQAETADRMGPQKSNWFLKVPRFGNLALSKQAIVKIADEKISDEQLWDVVYNGTDRSDETDIVLREKDGVRLVIDLKTTPFKDAKVVVTAFRMKAQLKTGVTR